MYTTAAAAAAAASALLCIIIMMIIINNNHDHDQLANQIRPAATKTTPSQSSLLITIKP
jgi:hypothetical protein